MSFDNNGQNRNKLFIVIFIVAAIVLIGFSGGYVYVGTNKFCGYTCHQMKTRAVIWSKSSHNHIKCIECHAEPGIAGEFKAHLDGMNYFKSFVKGKTQNLTIFATHRNPARLKACIHCHPEDKLIEETDDIRIDHVSHVVRDEFLCTDCHKDMIHGEHSLKVDLVKPEEKNCVACHLKEGANTHCQSCHKRKVVRGQRQLFVLDALEDRVTEAD